MGIPTSFRAVDGQSTSSVIGMLQKPLHYLTQCIFYGYICTRRFKNSFINLDVWSGQATQEQIHNSTCKLSKKPRHLSAILTGRGHNAEMNTRQFIKQTVDLAIWCACAEITVLSVYERSGLLKIQMKQVCEAVTQSINSWCPHKYADITIVTSSGGRYTLPSEKSGAKRFTLYLLAEDDGRQQILRLTQSLAEKFQESAAVCEVSVSSIDAEISNATMPEPDLLLLFSPHIELIGYPPWQLRLVEMFYLQDNSDFKYRVFLKALQNYARAEMRYGK